MLSKEELIAHLESVRKRTWKYVQALPQEVMDWRPGADKFSIGDLIRHLGSVEVMFVHAIKHNEWKYDGHGPEKGSTKQEAMDYLEHCHRTAIEQLQQLEPSHLTSKVKNMLGYEVSAWRMIMALAEHEIHHRGQLSAYMQENGIEPPQIFGLKIEQIPESDR